MDRAFRKIVPMSEEDQTTEKKIEVKRARNSPKHSQDTWFKVRMEYESGNWTSQRELGEKYGIHEKTLWARINLEKWDVRRLELLRKAELKIEKVAVNQGSEYLQKSFLRVQKFEELVEKSADQVGELVDPDMLDVLTRSLARLHAMGLSALRIPAVASVDLTSKGLSVGESIVSAIAKLRAAGGGVEVTDEQIRLIGEMEIVP